MVNKILHTFSNNKRSNESSGDLEKHCNLLCDGYVCSNNVICYIHNGCNSNDSSRTSETRKESNCQCGERGRKTGHLAFAIMTSHHRADISLDVTAHCA